MNQHRTLTQASSLYLSSKCSQKTPQAAAKPDNPFELFHRAFDLGDDHAWFTIQHQYRPMFIRWVLESATIQLDHFIVEDLLQNALARFWTSLSTSERPLDERFSHTGELLKYMRLCVKSAYREWQRRELRQDRIHQQMVTTTFSVSAQRPLEQLWMQKEHTARCEGVRYWLETHCQNEAEKLIYQLTFEEELKPRQIVARHPEHFPDVKDVYRIKLRLYRRIQRAFGEQAPNETF